MINAFTMGQHATLFELKEFLQGFYLGTESGKERSTAQDQTLWIAVRKMQDEIDNAFARERGLAPELNEQEKETALANRIRAVTLYRNRTGVSLSEAYRKVKEYLQDPEVIVKCPRYCEACESNYSGKRGDACRLPGCKGLLGLPSGY